MQFHLLFIHLVSHWQLVAFFKCDRVSMNSFLPTVARCTLPVSASLSSDGSFYPTVPLSVVWRQAFFSSTPRWFALLYSKTVKIILWARHLQPTPKSFSHAAFSPVTSAWVGKSLEQNTLTQWSQCFYCTLWVFQTWTHFELPDVNFSGTLLVHTSKNMNWNMWRHCTAAERRSVVYL